MDHKRCEKPSDLPKKDTITEVGESSNRNYQMNEDSKLQELTNSLNRDQRTCLEIFLMFPEKTELKKRLLIYCWIGLFCGVSEDYENVFSVLMEKKVLIAIHREHNNVIDHFIIEPTLHKCLVSNVNNEIRTRIRFKKWEEGSLCLYRWGIDQYFRMLVNLDQRYLNSKDIMNIISKHDHLRVVQLGSWHYTPLKIQETGSEEIKSKDHIEVDQTDFLKKLRPDVIYFSLQGISGITELPESVFRLSDMEILNLRACHNLEKLPDKLRFTLKEKIMIGSFLEIRWMFQIGWGSEKLRVLDVSECYLLEHLPKWICWYSNLNVIKGFVVGSLGNKNQSCRLNDLTKLKYLRKLSMRFTNDILDPEVFQGFNSLNSLLVLTITWGENKYKEIPTYYLPKNLGKLDMRCYPEADASKWRNPEELNFLKRLYIRGGNLTKIPYNDNWKVEILRIRFLRKLVPTNWNEIKSSFKNLKYMEYVGCPKPINFPNKDGSSWRNIEE